MTAFFALRLSLLNPQTSRSRNDCRIHSFILFQFVLKTLTVLESNCLTLNLMLSLKRTRQVFNMKSSLIMKPGLPMPKTSVTRSERDFLASDPSSVVQFAIVIDISKLEKLRGVPPLFVLMNMSKTASMSCFSYR